MSNIATLINRERRNFMKVRSADGVSVAYRAVGSGKPTIVFIHGFCCDQSYWDAQVPHFARHYKVVTIDLAGHGESGLDRKTWTGRAFGDDVVAVVKELNFDRVVLVGHSMGGSVIAQAARQMPECVMGLVGVDTYRDVEQTRDRRQTEQFLSALQANFVDTMRRFVKDRFTPGSDPVLVERVAAGMSSASPEVGSGIVRDMFLESLPLASVFEEVKAPIRCIASDRNTVNIEAARRYASSFHVVYMSDVGHFVMMEDPDTFNRLLDGIVEEFVSYQAEAT